MKASSDTADCFTPFKSAVSSVPIPSEFTFPFYYEPHELSRIAVKELQEKLSTKNFQHNFGLDDASEGEIIGKMFGVLVVRNDQGKLGYLSAFSGKLGNSNHHEGFVPPVFDMLQKGDFFLDGMQQLNEINAKVKAKEEDHAFLSLASAHQLLQKEAELDIENFREEMRTKKRRRKEKRMTLNGTMNTTERAIIENELIRESLHYKHLLKTKLSEWRQKIELSQAKKDAELATLNALKKERKEFSNLLQNKIFKAYSFLNANGNNKNLLDIFQEIVGTEPPAGAGECAAPKLLQYAYTHNMKPIAMAEFWWGASPKSEIRKHGNFYPSCRGKCEPILGHMLKGLKVAPNPMLTQPDYIAPLEVVYEDESLVIVNKPADFLSVPGKSDLPNMYDRIKDRYPNATGPMVVHRLDMATSGILLFTKTKEANKLMQKQFIDKTVSKRYVALLDGFLNGDQGIVDLPLRLDLNDRPRQLVCYEHGKEAITHWKVVDRLYGKTRIHFYPVTGRTHQLRMHAAHPDGLNLPIVGDDLYGTKDKRLHLHAEQITFVHPETRKKQTVRVKAPF